VKHKTKTQNVGPLEPNMIVRKKDAYKYFGLKPTAIDEGIKVGRIPKPMRITGGAVGWLGSQIMEWQQRLIEGGE
jgi:predicted DNA-binding transcriptional regulator AlpA